MAESFFSTLEAELLSRRRFASQAEAKMACFSYIEGWYNPVRDHVPDRGVATALLSRIGCSIRLPGAAG